MKHTQVCEAVQGNVKHKCESLPNVKPTCFSGSTDHGSNQSVHSSLDDYQASPKGTQGNSDPTAKAIFLSFF